MILPITCVHPTKKAMRMLISPVHDHCWVVNFLNICYFDRKCLIINSICISVVTGELK